jgi:DNA invertase Pin-like site-specific DNA recombinase
MSAEARRLLRALLERVSARMDDLDQRFAALERAAFQIDDLEARVAELEQRPPTPLGGRELQRRRVEAVLQARADGMSLNAIERATGVSRATVRRLLVREGDPAPARVRRTGGGTYPSHPSRNGDGRAAS